MNRIGDFGLALAIILIFTNFQSVDYCVIFSLVLKYKNFLVNFLGFEIHLLTLLGILLFIGAVGKSAQLGLHT
jgi:NADH-quinone oxidoreductase subunit L